MYKGRVKQMKKNSKLLYAVRTDNNNLKFVKNVLKLCCVAKDRSEQVVRAKER